MAHTLDLSSARLQAGAVRSGAMREALGKLDFSRIAAESGAIVIHVVALMLLLAPMSVPQAPAETYVDPPYILELPRDPPPPPPPPVVQVVRPSAPTQTPIVQPTHVEPPPILVTENSELDLRPTQIVADVSAEPANTLSEPLAGAHLEYETAPPPRYTAEMMRANLQGTVLLRVLVGVDGKPLEVAIERSSGHRELDQAARRQVLAKWRFKPAVQDGQTVQAIGLVPVNFTLD